MDGFMEKLQAVLIPLSDKLNRSKILKGISGGFAAMLPIVMVGAIFSLLNSLNIAPYQNFITAIGLKPLLAIPGSYTTDMISLYAVFLIAKAEAEAIGIDSRKAVSSGLMALMFFLLLIPLGVTGVHEASGENVFVAGAVNTMFLGSVGLFTAMIVGLAIPYLHNFFIKNNITIRMPETVPPMISESFGSMIPALCIAAIAVAVRFACSFTEAGTFTMLIYNALRAPLAAMAASPLTFIILLLVCNVLWTFGIHGGMVATSIMNMLYTTFTNENLAAFNAGQPLPNIIIGPAWATIGNICGSGCAIGLVICIALFARSERYKALAKIAVPSGLCGISEPLVFGVPLVLNPITMIPMLLAPIVTFLLGYAAMAIGLVPYMNGVGVSLGTPILLSGFMAYGDFRGVILQFVLALASAAVWFPFFKILDGQATKEESGEVETA